MQGRNSVGVQAELVLQLVNLIQAQACVSCLWEDQHTNHLQACRCWDLSSFHVHAPYGKVRAGPSTARGSKFQCCWPASSQMSMSNWAAAGTWSSSSMYQQAIEWTSAMLMQSGSEKAVQNRALCQWDGQPWHHQCPSMQGPQASWILHDTCRKTHQDDCEEVPEPPG